MQILILTILDSTSRQNQEKKWHSKVAFFSINKYSKPQALH